MEGAKSKAELCIVKTYLW